jgi:hypothetical protein
MATLGNYYLNGPSLSTATKVFTDFDQTICAPDGWYSDGIVSRKLTNCKLEAQQSCSNCNENLISLQFNSVSAAELFCVGSTNVSVYMALGEIFSTGTAIYQDAALTVAAVNGFYREPFNADYREQALGVLGVLTTGPSCSGDFFISANRTTCNVYCNNSYDINISATAVSGNDYFTLTIGDVVQVGGLGLADGFYAYAETSTNTGTGTFKVFEILSGQIVDISQCISGTCQPQ